MKDLHTTNPVKLNEGTIWRHPLESWYGRARRRLVANPALGRSQLNAAFDHRGERDGVDRLSPYLPGRSAIRQCPECAKRLFHPTVYQVASLVQCPLHRCAFTMTCPGCHQRWDRVLTVKTPECSICGRPPWQELGKTQLPAKVYGGLRWLDGWFARCQRRRQTAHQPTLYDIRTLTARAGDIESPRFTTPTPTHPFYAAFESQKMQGRDNERLRRLSVRTLDEPLRERRTTLTVWFPHVELPRPLETWDGQWGNEPEPSPRQIQNVGLAIRRIMRWQRRLTGRSHLWTWWDLRSLRPEDVRERSLPCVLCMAFSYWCHALTWKYIPPSCVGTPGEHELCRFAAHSRFPITPEHVYLETADQRRFRPSSDFERWLFLRATDYLFLECVQFALWIQRCAAPGDVHFQQTVYSQRYHFQPPSLASQLIELEQQDSALKASYWHASPLQELEIPEPALRGIHRCPAFLRYPCDPIWSLSADPHWVDRQKVMELFLKVLPRLKWSQCQYPHSSHFFSPPPTPTTYWHDLRAVMGDNEPVGGV